MFEQAFKYIDDVLWKEAGCTSVLDTEDDDDLFNAEEWIRRCCVVYICPSMRHCAPNGMQECPEPRGYV
jgi:hypothetical protein